MNEQQLDSVLTRSPRLFHMAELGAWDGIRRDGLLSTSALLDLYEVHGGTRFELESERRNAIAPLQAHGLSGAKLRDQLAMDDAGLRKCLEDGMTPRQWYECLNAKVFFWLTQERLDRLSGAKPYRSGEREVLVLDSRELVTAYRDKIWLCPMNSGATKPMPHPRGRSTFSRIGDYPYDKRPPRERVVELCVDYGVEDVERFVRRVYVVKGTKVVRELAL